MGNPILYQLPQSPAVRSVKLLAKAINLDLEERYVSLLDKDNFKPEFLELNPHHTVPTLDDNGHIIWDSHAINIYLIEKYAKDESLYPHDPVKRSTINQRLFFNIGVLFPVIKNCTYEILFYGHAKTSEKHLQDIRNAYELLNVLFRGNRFLADDTITLADYAAVTIITQIEIYLKIDDSAYPNINPWIRRVAENIKNFNEINTEVVQKHKEYVENRMKENAANEKNVKL